MNKQKLLALLPFMSLTFSSCTPPSVSSETVSSSEENAVSSSEGERASSETSVDSEQAFIDSLEWKYNSSVHYKEYNGKRYCEKQHDYLDGTVYQEFQWSKCFTCHYRHLGTHPFTEIIGIKEFDTFAGLESFFEDDYAKNEENYSFRVLKPANLVGSEENSFDFHYDNRWSNDGVYSEPGVLETFYVYDDEIGKVSSDLDYSFKVTTICVSNLRGDVTSDPTYEILINDDWYEVLCFYEKGLVGDIKVYPNCNASSDYYLNYVKDNMVVMPSHR